MTARRAAIADLPDWPRLLSREQAAAYVGVSANHFEAHVSGSVRRVEIGKRVLFDRRSIDAWVDACGARHHAPADKWLERLDGDPVARD